MSTAAATTSAPRQRVEVTTRQQSETAGYTYIFDAITPDARCNIATCTSLSMAISLATELIAEGYDVVHESAA